MKLSLRFKSCYFAVVKDIEKLLWKFLCRLNISLSRKTKVYKISACSYICSDLVHTSSVVHCNCHSRGVARIFQRGGGGHTVSNIIVMAFSPRNIVGCFLKKRFTKGSRAPQDPPRYAFASFVYNTTFLHTGLFLEFLFPQISLPQSQVR